ncbi:MAG: DUF3108 domain-containing protein [Thiobacillus sp.]|nr:DUF3108 domain-containing protein [Thiobacillus sp.]
MSGRSVRPWWIALTGSLLLHAGLLGGVSWTLPQRHVPSGQALIEARLVPLTPAKSPPASDAKPPTASPRPSPAPPPARRAEPVVETAAPAIAVDADAVVAIAEPIVAPLDDAPGIEAVSAKTSAPEAAAELPPLNVLPPRIEMRYQVRYGPASGEQTLLWVRQGDDYTVTSVVAATGLTGLFYRGRFVQTSRGRITPHGLQPEEFWDQRGNKRSSARFDTGERLLTLNPAKGAPRHFAYQGDVQDALSLFFQLALTAPPSAGQLTYTVFNGKKLRDYTYEVRGVDTLETALGAVRVLHLVRVTDGDGRFEVWLAIDRHYLPVRVLRSDDKGSEMELELRSISP